MTVERDLEIGNTIAGATVRRSPKCYPKLERMAERMKIWVPLLAAFLAGFFGSLEEFAADWSYDLNCIIKILGLQGPRPYRISKISPVVT